MKQTYEKRQCTCAGQDSLRTRMCHCTQSPIEIELNKLKTEESRTMSRVIINELRHGSLDVMTATLDEECDKASTQELAAAILNLAGVVDRHLTTDHPAPGKGGTGACFCKCPPEEQIREYARSWGRVWGEDRDKTIKDGMACIDHRCPYHGVSAQPKLWGRKHTAVELYVAAREWYSIGVVYEQR